MNQEDNRTEELVERSTSEECRTVRENAQVAFNPLSGMEHTVALIKQLHKGQTDHLGDAYEGHPQRVAENIKRIFPECTEDMLKAALLHDVIEDCGVDTQYLRRQGYSEDCIAMVALLTKPPGDSREYDEMVDGIIASGNKEVMIIKIADNMDNLHPERVRRLLENSPEKGERLAVRYRRAIEKLSGPAGLKIDEIWQAVENAPALDASTAPAKNSNVGLAL